MITIKIQIQKKNKQAIPQIKEKLLKKGVNISETKNKKKIQTNKKNTMK